MKKNGNYNRKIRWFAQWLLCKPQPMDITVIDIDQNFTYWSWSHDIFNSVINYDGIMSLFVYNYSDIYNINIYKNDVIEKTYSRWTHTSETISININKWDTIKISINHTYSYSRTWYLKFKGTIPIESSNIIKWKPRYLKSLWYESTVTIFWKHIDWTWIDHQ